MKKFFFLSLIAFQNILGSAQGVDPAVYPAKEGYTLQNLWLYAAGNGVDGVAISDWNELTNKMANPGKARMAARLGDYVYISCSQDYKVGEDGATVVDHSGHLLVLEAATGKFVKDLKLTYEGAPYVGLLCANCIGVDDFGHLWITPYVSSTYSINEATGEEVIKPVPMYMVNTESGEMTKIYDFAQDFGAGGRVDYCDVSGDITREKARCVFMAIPNEAPIVTAWHSEQGSEEWLFGVNENYDDNIIYCVETPTNKAGWNYSPMVAIVGDDEFSGVYFYTDGHSTMPARYACDGDMLEDLSSFTLAAEDTWANFIPELRANGVREFGLGNDRFLAFAIRHPDNTNFGGEIAIIKLDENVPYEYTSIENATPLWSAPEGHLGLNKGEGCYNHGISISPIMTDNNGKEAVEILIYKDCNGIGLYRLAEEGYNGEPTIKSPYVTNGVIAEVFNIPANTISGIQFDAEIPEGVEFEICPEAKALMSVHETTLAGNIKRFIAYTNDGETLNTDFICTAFAAEASRSKLNISNIILSVEDNPVHFKDIQVPVLGYGLSGLKLPDASAGDSYQLPVPEEINYDGVTVSWQPYFSEIGDLTENGIFTAKEEGLIDDLALTIHDPWVKSVLNATATIFVSGHLGDVDGSGSIDIADVVATVNYILMLEPENFFFARADLDHSGDINVADVTRLIKLVLAQPKEAIANAPMRAKALNSELDINAIDAKLSDDGKRHIYLCLDSERDYTALQADIQLTDNVRIANISAGENLTAHAFRYTQLDEATVRVVLYSLNLASLPAGQHLVDLTLEGEVIPEESRIIVSSAISADADGNAFGHSNVEADINGFFQGVNDAVADTFKVTSENNSIIVEAPQLSDVKIYDLQGREIGTWIGCGTLTVEKGVYIVSATGYAPAKVDIK